MSIRDLIMASAGASAKPLYAEDAFASVAYSGNNAITNFVTKQDLAGKGGLVWAKPRNNSSYDHMLYDTVRGRNSELSTDSTSGDNNLGDLPSDKDFMSFNSDGFTLGGVYGTNLNLPGTTYGAWSFCRDPKFFNIITWTGDGVDGRVLQSNLSVDCSLVIIKRLDVVAPWYVCAKTNNTSQNLILNSNAGTNSPASYNGGTATLSGPAITVNGSFIDGNINTVNALGGRYIAYAFGNDTTPASVVKTGRYTGNGNAVGPTVELGWQPQFILIKSLGSPGDWVMLDTTRGLTVDGASPPLFSNSTAAEVINTVYANVTNTGFQIKTTDVNFNRNTNDYVYLAIRMPNKPPVTGTDVFKPLAINYGSSGSAITGVGFSPDFIIGKARDNANNNRLANKLMGPALMTTTMTSDAESSTAHYVSFDINGFTLGAGFGAANYSFEVFKRAPGFFDIVAYTGTGAALNVPHALGVAPELVLIKNRGTPQGWTVVSNAGAWHNTGFNVAPTSDSTVPANFCTSTAIAPNVYTDTNTSGYRYEALLFASLKGISKVGSYTGNGLASQTIDCGFTTGARFVMIKAANLSDANSQWYVWDTARGLVAANDPHLSLNGPGATEVTTDDSLDPTSVGFVVNSTSILVNNLGTVYTYLAIS